MASHSWIPQNLSKRPVMVTWYVTSRGGGVYVGGYADPWSLLTSDEPISECQVPCLKDKGKSG